MVAQGPAAYLSADCGQRPVPALALCPYSRYGAVMYMIDVRASTYTTREPDDDGWDRGDYASDFEVEGLHRKIEGQPSWRMDTVEEYSATYGLDDIPAGETAHVVFVRYSTGDTFGSNDTFCVAAVKRDRAEAEEAARKCGERHDVSRDGYRSWDGYFESFQSATVYTFTVQ